MADGYIDSASISGAVAAFDYGSSKTWHPWAYQSVMTTTSLLLCHSRLWIAPGLGIVDVVPGKVSDLYDFTYEHLQPVSIVEPKNYLDASKLANAKKFAIRKLDDWVKSDIQHAREAVNVAKRNKSYEPWLEWVVKNAWVGHSQRLNGLFNFEMLPALALVLNCNQNLLYTVWQKTRDLEQVRELAQRQRGEDFVLARDAYFASAVFRGTYHELVARRSKWQLTHHPLREAALVQASEGKLYPFPKPAGYFTYILVNGAMKEPTTKGKIALWAKNIQIAKAQPRIISPLYQPEDDENVAQKTAMEIAKKLRIRLYPDWLKLVDVGLGLGISLTAFVLSPWVSIVVSAGAGGVIFMARPVQRIAQVVTLSQRNLQRLASSPPGRITEKWGA